MDVVNMSRRKFLAASAVSAGVGVCFQHAGGSANDRISIGIVGAGERGSALLEEIAGLRESHNVTVTGVCDVWKTPLNRGAEYVQAHFGAAPYTTTRFGELLVRDDIDAIVIATPDFAHAPILIEAIKSHKDVYVEKPMAMEINEATEAVALAESHKSVVQVGTQWRSVGLFKAAQAYLKKQELGHISRISAAMSFNSPRWPRVRDLSRCRREDVDWQAYLFNRPMQDFDPKLLCHWHLYRMFTTGLPGLWMSHFVDMVNMLTGASYPSSAVALGGNYVWKDGRETTDVFHALLDYPEGFLFDWVMSLTNAYSNYFNFYGRYGTLRLLPEYAYSGEGGEEGKQIEAGALEQQADESHMANWFDCIRQRQRPRADILCGHQHSVAAIMATKSLDSGERISYDPVRQQLGSA